MTPGLPPRQIIPPEAPKGTPAPQGTPRERDRSRYCLGARELIQKYGGTRVFDAENRLTTLGDHIAMCIVCTQQRHNNPTLREPDSHREPEMYAYLRGLDMRARQVQRKADRRKVK